MLWYPPLKSKQTGFLTAAESYPSWLWSFGQSLHGVVGPMVSVHESQQTVLTNTAQPECCPALASWVSATRPVSQSASPLRSPYWEAICRPCSPELQQRLPRGQTWGKPSWTPRTRLSIHVENEQSIKSCLNLWLTKTEGQNEVDFVSGIEFGDNLSQT